MLDRYAAKGLAGEPLDGLVIDAHGHLGEMPSFPLVTQALDRLVAGMDRLGVRVMAVSATPALFNHAARGNRLVDTALRAYPDRFFGYMAADIGYPARIVPELERCLAGGFRGVKIWSYGEVSGIPYDHPNYRLIFEFADAHCLPVLAHTWGGELAQLEPAIRRYPGITWLLAHAACTDRGGYVRLARQYPNVYLELCFSPCPRGLVERLVEDGVADRLVWGTDAIFMGAAQQLGRVLFAQIPEDTKADIIGRNAARALEIAG